VCIDTALADPCRYMAVDTRCVGLDIHIAHRINEIYRCNTHCPNIYHYLIDALARMDVDKLDLKVHVHTSLAFSDILTDELVGVVVWANGILRRKCTLRLGASPGLTRTSNATGLVVVHDLAILPLAKVRESARSQLNGIWEIVSIDMTYCAGRQVLPISRRSACKVSSLQRMDASFSV
jgi:hypothetical protein